MQGGGTLQVMCVIQIVLMLQNLVFATDAHETQIGRRLVQVLIIFLEKVTLV